MDESSEVGENTEGRQGRREGKETEENRTRFGRKSGGMELELVERPEKHLKNGRGVVLVLNFKVITLQPCKVTFLSSNCQKKSTAYSCIMCVVF